MVRSKTWKEGSPDDIKPHFVLTDAGWYFYEEGLSKEDDIKACEFCNYLNGRT